MSQLSRKTILSDVGTALALLLLGMLFLSTGAGLVRHWQDGAARNQDPAVEDLLGVASAGAGAALVTWWLLSAAAALTGELLERQGKVRTAAAARRFSPVFMQRLAVALVSVQLVSAAAANAVTRPQDLGWNSRPHYAAPVAGTAASGAPRQEDSAAPSPFTALPTGPAALPAAVSASPDSERQAGSATSTLEPAWRPSAPSVEPVPPGLLAQAPARTADPDGNDDHHQAAAVAVLAGDTLWDIAARHLGPGAPDAGIALEWPRWYEANKGTIGPDPDVLRPGQVLLPPPA
jgi:hypothetical protein